MNAFQKCSFTGDAVPLYLPQGLYLKPIAQITITVYLPPKLFGAVVSKGEVMEKLRSLIRPDVFTVFKVFRNTIEVIIFHAEIEDKTKLDNVIIKLDKKLIKLNEFHVLFKVHAEESRLNFPNKQIWDSFFRDAKDMNGEKPGERADTIHISNLPIKWFVPYHLSGEEDMKPSEKMFYRIFEKFGRIRHIDIPICDPYRNKMKSDISGLQIFSFDEKELFEGYVQFKDYGGFVRAMDAFRGMKLLHRDHDVNEMYMVNIKVDVDRTKHMTEPSIKRREIVRDRIIIKQRDIEKREQIEKEAILKKEEARLKKEEAEKQEILDLKKERDRRRDEREENRKAKILGQLRVKDAGDIHDMMIKEKKKLRKSHKKLKAIRIVDKLLTKREIKQSSDTNSPSYLKSNDELLQSETHTETHQTIAGRRVLNSVLTEEPKTRRDPSNSDTSLSSEEPENDKNPVTYRYPIQNSHQPYFGSMYTHDREKYLPYQYKRRDFQGAGPSGGFTRGRSYRGYYRGGYNPRYRAGYNLSYRGGQNSNYRYDRSPSYRDYNKNVQYPPELHAEYVKYFQKFLRDPKDEDKKSPTTSRSSSTSSLSRSRARSSSVSRRTRTRSYSPSRRSRFGSRNRLRSRSRSTSRSRRSHTSRTHSTYTSSSKLLANKSRKSISKSVTSTSKEK